MKEALPVRDMIISWNAWSDDQMGTSVTRYVCTWYAGCATWSHLIRSRYRDLPTVKILVLMCSLVAISYQMEQGFLAPKPQDRVKDRYVICLQNQIISPGLKYVPNERFSLVVRRTIKFAN